LDFKPIAKNNCRNILRPVPPSGCPEFALQRALPEDKLKRLSDFPITIPGAYMQVIHRRRAPSIVVCSD